MQPISALLHSSNCVDSLFLRAVRIDMSRPVSNPVSSKKKFLFEKASASFVHRVDYFDFIVIFL